MASLGRERPVVPEGWTVLRTKSYLAAQQRLAIALREIEFEKLTAENARQWARNAFTEERRLRDRCTYLYGLAASLGATDDDLKGFS